jgi:hypothetical protein
MQGFRFVSVQEHSYGCFNILKPTELLGWYRYTLQMECWHNLSAKISYKSQILHMKEEIEAIKQSAQIPPITWEKSLKYKF